MFTLPKVENNDGQMETMAVNSIVVGSEFIEIMEIEIIAGRDFSKKLQTDIGTSLLVNATLVKTMGWETPVGKGVVLEGGGEARVVGVVQDFHFTHYINLLLQFSYNRCHPAIF